jgi:hypothetical protein
LMSFLRKSGYELCWQYSLLSERLPWNQEKETTLA